MKKLFFCLSLLCAFSAVAKDIDTDTISLQAMDKITGRVKTLTFPVGSQVQFEDLTIKVDRCLTKSPEETPENAAFLKVVLTAEEPTELFKGWMFSSNPALSAMENAVYDIWVVSCYNQETLVPEQSEPVDSLETEENTEELEDPNEPIED